MKQDEHVDVYRAAFESASSELTEILGEFEKLLRRKDQVEKLVTVLKPLVSVDEHVAVAESNPDTITPEGQAAETPMASSEETMERGPDPFQRRIDHVLGIGAGIRDVRKYSRQF
jgi:hypothetical protein